MAAEGRINSHIGAGGEHGQNRVVAVVVGKRLCPQRRRSGMLVLAVMLGRQRSLAVQTQAEVRCLRKWQVSCERA
eukprot:166610-Pleurochrysis_carterae.AAC.1